MEITSSSHKTKGNSFQAMWDRLESNTDQQPENFREEPSTSSKNLANSYFQDGLQVSTNVYVKKEMILKRENRKKNGSWEKKPKKMRG